MKKKALKSVLIVFLMLSLGLGGCWIGSEESAIKPVISNLSFSLDNDKIIFFHSKGEGAVGKMAIYDISRHELYEYNGMPYWPKFSHDGKMRTFVSGRSGSNDRNIFIVNADGSGERQLTHDYNDYPVIWDKYGSAKVIHNEEPSFSPDGKRVIFKRSGRFPKIPWQSPTLTDWDIYEVEIDTGRERRLTNHKSFLMSGPFYLSNGEQYIFWGNKISNVVSKELNNNDQNRCVGEGIFITDRINSVPIRIAPYGWWRPGPSVSWNDTIIFRDVINEMDGLKTEYRYDLFTYKGGNIKRLTKMQTFINDFSISPDGKRAVFIGGEMGKSSLWILNTDGTGLARINLPWEQLNRPKNTTGKDR